MGTRMLWYGVAAGMGIGALWGIYISRETTGIITYKWEGNARYNFEIDKKVIVRVDGAVYSRFNVGDSYTYKNIQIVKKR